MAHLLEHMVFKGSTKHPNIPQELTEHGARPNGTTVLRPHQLLRDVSGDGREPEVGARPRSRPDGEFLHPQGRSRQRIHRRPQRVRSEREQSDQRPASAGVVRGLSLASVRALGHRQPGRHRERADRQAPGVLQEVLPAGQRRADVSGKIDEATLLPLISDSFGPIPAPARTLDTTYTVEPVQDGERAVTLRRVGDIQAVLAVYHVPAGSDPDFAAIERARGSRGGQSVGTPLQGAGRQQEGRAGRRAQPCS